MNPSSGVNSRTVAKDDRVVIQNEVGEFVGRDAAGRIVFTHDPKAAFVYDFIADHVRIRIAEVYRLYGKVWKAVPLASVVTAETPITGSESPLESEYTVLFYVVPDGRHDSETMVASDATEAAVQVRTKLLLRPEHFEVIAVINGQPAFEVVDHRRVRLAP